MATTTMTLVQALRQIEENGTNVKIGNFETFTDFMSYFNQHYKPLLETLRRDWQNANNAQRFIAGDLLSAFSEEKADGDADPMDGHSEDYRNGIAYVLENLDADDKAIIRAECNKAYKSHLVPTGDIVDDSQVLYLLEEYGQDNGLPEGWYEEEYDSSEILSMI